MVPTDPNSEVDPDPDPEADTPVPSQVRVRCERVTVHRDSVLVVRSQCRGKGPLVRDVTPLEVRSTVTDPPPSGTSGVERLVRQLHLCVSRPLE